MSLWSGIYTRGENYSDTLLYDRGIVSKTEQSLIEEKRCQRTLSESLALGWDLCVQIYEPFLSKLKTLHQTQLSEHTRNRLPTGWAKEPGLSSQAVCSGVKTCFGWSALPMSVSPQRDDGPVPWWTWHWVWGVSSLCLWGFSAWGHIPTALPATGAAWESLDPLWTHSAAFLRGPKGWFSWSEPGSSFAQLSAPAVWWDWLSQPRTKGTNDGISAKISQGMCSHSMQCLWNLHQPHLTTAACCQECL